MLKVAILVDGAFYLKRAYYLWGEKAPKERANELISYCQRHLKKEDYCEKMLYRIFYYDCLPSDKIVYHPFLKKNIDLSKTDLYKWSIEFFEHLKSKRKLAFRKGELMDSNISYVLTPEIIKKLCRGSIKFDDLREDDFTLNIQQKGVDMKIGLDIATLSYKKQVDQIILIAGDSDFVPAAKYARREGVDFILDPMWHTIKQSLYEHIDGLTTKVARPDSENIKKDALYKKNP